MQCLTLLCYPEKFSAITVQKWQDQNKTYIVLTHVHISQSLLRGTGSVLSIAQNTKVGTDFWRLPLKCKQLFLDSLS